MSKRTLLRGYNDGYLELVQKHDRNMVEKL